MRTVLKAIFAVIAGVLTTSPAESGDYLVIESAAGVGSRVFPFSREWSGKVGSEGLFFKEYAARISYSPVKLFTARCGFGWSEYYSRSDVRFAIHPPPLEHWGPSERTIKAIYIIPSVRTTLPMMRIDTGFLLYVNDDDDYRYYQAGGSFNDKLHVWPSIGVELGDENAIIYGRLLDSFPMVSGGGAWEFGIGYRIDNIYDHAVYLASGFQTIGLGYRGELKLYKQTGISIGVSAGGVDHENVYNLTLGIITAIGR